MPWAAASLLPVPVWFDWARLTASASRWMDSERVSVAAVDWLVLLVWVWVSLTASDWDAPCCSASLQLADSSVSTTSSLPSWYCWGVVRTCFFFKRSIDGNLTISPKNFASTGFLWRK